MKKRLRFYTETALAAAILSLLSPIAVPLGPLPLTLSSLAISTLSGVLGAAVGFLAVLVYLAIGAVGVPVYSGFTAGFGVLFGPSVGFFVGYLILAILSGQTAKLKSSARLRYYLPILLLGEAALLSLGAVGYALVLGISLAKAAAAAFLPFLIPAVCKAFFGAWLLSRLRRGRLLQILSAMGAKNDTNSKIGRT